MKNILALTYWSFKEPLIQSGALPYLKIISSIISDDSSLFLFTLEKKQYALTDKEYAQVNAELSKYKITLIRKKYYNFGVKAFLSWFTYLADLIFIIFKNRIRFIHAFGTPAGAIGYLLACLTRKKLIIDCYEPHADAMVENGNWKSDSLAYKILFQLERLETKYSHALIAHTNSIRDYIDKNYNVALNECFIRSNSVDFELFDFKKCDKEKIRQEIGIGTDDVVGIYVGKLGGIYLDEEIFELIKCAKLEWGNTFKMILLTDTDRLTLDTYLEKYELDKNDLISLFTQHNEVKNYLSIANFAVCAVKPIPTKRYCSPIKTGEYWAMGLPVIIPSNIGDDSMIIESETIGAVLPSLNVHEYTVAIKKIDSLIHFGNIDELQQKIISIALKYRSIDKVSEIYRTIYG